MAAEVPLVWFLGMVEALWVPVFPPGQGAFRFSDTSPQRYVMKGEASSRRAERQ